MWTSPQVDALYRETRYAVFLRCKSLLRDDAEARDVTQEVYLYLLDHPSEFRGDASPATYLYAIATNRSLSRIRGRVARDERWRDAVANIVGVDPSNEARTLVPLDGESSASIRPGVQNAPQSWVLDDARGREHFVAFFSDVPLDAPQARAAALAERPRLDGAIAVVRECIKSSKSLTP